MNLAKFPSFNSKHKEGDDGVDSYVTYKIIVVENGFLLEVSTVEDCVNQYVFSTLDGLLSFLKKCIQEN